jgi:hypothetical protein
MLKSFKELRGIDISKYVKKRDGSDYLNWAIVKQLLHDNGAEKVYFIPLTNDKGSSLFMSDIEFTNNDKKNRCYETRIKIVIDELEFEMQSPVMNGANPVQDNSMSQQRVWNSMCRSFVKGVAMHTGLGFDLWCKQESKEFDEDAESDLSIHNLFKIKERMQENYTSILKKGFTTKEIAVKLNKTEDEVKALFTYFDILNNFERDLSKL